MNKDDTKQAIIGFMEFTKGITGNKDLKIPEDIAKEYGIEQDEKDTISRQEAIDAFSMFAEYESNRTNAEWVDRIRVVLSSLPPVQPIRPRGHWINKEVTDYYRVVGNCSECKERRIIDNFCPSCGADMREEQA